MQTGQPITSFSQKLTSLLPRRLSRLVSGTEDEISRSNTESQSFNGAIPEEEVKHFCDTSRLQDPVDNYFFGIEGNEEVKTLRKKGEYDLNLRRSESMSTYSLAKREIRKIVIHIHGGGFVAMSSRSH